MKRLAKCMAATGVLCLATHSLAQTVPVCPTSPGIVLGVAAPFAGGRPINSNDQIALAIRQETPVGGPWDFPISNVVVTGSIISGVALGIVGFGGVPAHVGVFGPVPAGDYTIVVQPIATNVTPNVNCPLLNIPLTVLQGYVAQPVPGPTGWLAALLVFLLAVAAGWQLRLGRRVTIPRR